MSSFTIWRDLNHASLLKIDGHLVMENDWTYDEEWVKGEVWNTEELVTQYFYFTKEVLDTAVFCGITKEHWEFHDEEGNLRTLQCLNLHAVQHMH